MISQVTKAYIRLYRDNRQITAYVEWIDHQGYAGRTECPAVALHRWPDNAHMRSLLARCAREDIQVTQEVW